jgi:hypothetical protein
MNDSLGVHMLITNYPVTLLWWLDFGHADGKYRLLSHNVHALQAHTFTQHCQDTESFPEF